MPPVNSVRSSFGPQSKFRQVVVNRIPPVTSGLIGLYDTDSYYSDSGTWVDISGNNNNASLNRGTVSKTTISGSGSSTNITTLSGGINDGILFPSSILPSTYTLFHIARRLPGTSGRIFNGRNGNWLSGFWGSLAGVAYHEGWLTSQSDVHGSNWVLSTDQNSLYRSNRVTRTGGTGGSANTRLTINAGADITEYTDGWNVAFVAVYNRTLNATEYGQVESYLSSRYGIA